MYNPYLYGFGIVQDQSFVVVEQEAGFKYTLRRNPYGPYTGWFIGACVRWTQVTACPTAATHVVIVDGFIADGIDCLEADGDDFQPVDLSALPQAMVVANQEDPERRDQAGQCDDERFHIVSCPFTNAVPSRTPGLQTPGNPD